MSRGGTHSFGLGWHAVAAGTIIACCLLIDPWFARWVRAWPEGLVQVFRTLTDLGRSHWYLVPTGLGTILFAILASRVREPLKHQALASLALACGFVLVAVASTGLLTTTLKYLIGRARPKLLDQEGTFGLAPFGLDADFASFPSGHANTAVAIALCLIFLWPRYRVPLAVFAVLIAFSRVAVGAHYPSDVIAGGYLAIVTTTAWRRVFAGQRLVFMPSADGSIVVRGHQIRRWMSDRLRNQVRLGPVRCRGWLRGPGLAGGIQDDRPG
jgi:membrane-associated phospholipid phosphatase